MLKPYTRQQIRTDKVLSHICSTYYRDILKQILTHKHTLYNIIPHTGWGTSLSDIITNTDSVVIVVSDILKPRILDKQGGDILGGVIGNEFVGTEYYTIYSDTTYIIETNYKNRWEVYARIVPVRNNV